VVLGLSVHLRACRESSDGKACGFSRTRFVVAGTIFSIGTAAEDVEWGYLACNFACCEVRAVTETVRGSKNQTAPTQHPGGKCHPRKAWVTAVVL
jgi:hypothetical protein